MAEVSMAEVRTAEIKMPALGADMVEATLLEWHVGVGDVVHRGDIIATVDTAKSALEVEALQEGRIEALLINPGTTVTGRCAALAARRVHRGPGCRAEPARGARGPVEGT